jgi:hypothetical protein
LSYALMQDVASSWDQYERVTAPLMDSAPAGLILHVAGPTDEGFRTIELWESEQAWQRFQAERLAPAIAALGGPARPEPTFRSLRPAHTVIGTAMARADRFRPQTGDALREATTTCERK